jgi:hypothetical protein
LVRLAFLIVPVHQQRGMAEKKDKEPVTPKGGKGGKRIVIVGASSGMGMSRL